MPSIFSLNTKDLRDLTPEDAVRVFRDLAWSEARKFHVPVNCFRASELVNVTDGGIDAQLVGTSPPAGSSILKWPRAGFQVKTGNFRATQRAVIQRELFGTNSRGNKRDPILANIKPAIAEVLNAGGAYVLVCYRPIRDIGLVVSNIRHFLDPLGFSSNDVEVWDANTLIGLLQPFPTLALRVNRIGGNFLFHVSWAREGGMDFRYFEEEENRKSISAIQDTSRDRTRAQHIRVVGEPGIGKTRVVFEATKEDDLAPMVAYFRKPSDFNNSELSALLVRADNEYEVILIIDDCARSEAEGIWNRLCNRGPRIGVVTIGPSYEEQFRGPFYVALDRLTDSSIRGIFAEYGIPDVDADRWAAQCEGIPRVAHIVGGNIRANAADVKFGISDIWTRFIAGRDDPKSAAVQRRTIILRYLALFKKFGYRPPVNDEANFVFDILNRDHGISKGEFTEAINVLLTNKILQGDHTLFISPSLLHVHLWCEWFEHHKPADFDFERFASSLPGNLRNWFQEMFIYAFSTGAARSVVDALLGECGPFSDGSYLEEESGAEFFMYLSEASPEAALDLLERTIGTWDRERLLVYRDGRRYVVWALEKIAVWRSLMPRAAKVLLSLAEAENENCANNATGTFAALFSPRVNTTEAPFSERLPVLEEALHSESKGNRRVALTACRAALSPYGGFRVIGPEYQGLRNTAELWRPKTVGDLLDCYKAVWRALWQVLVELNEEEKGPCIDVLLYNVRGLISIRNLADEVIAGLKRISEEHPAKREDVLRETLEVLHFDSDQLEEDVVSRLRALTSKLTGSDFYSLLNRYAGSKFFTDNFLENGQYGDAAKPRLEKLAHEAIATPSKLDPVLNWLVSPEAKNSNNFGYELGILDTALKLLPRLIEATRKTGINGGAFFVSGYLRALYEGDINAWEEVLDGFAADTFSCKWVPEITWRCGLTNRAAERYLKLVASDRSLLSYSNLFVFGGEVNKVSPEIFYKWLRLLIEEGTSDTQATALSLFFVYYIHDQTDKVFPEDLAYEVLFSDAGIRLVLNPGGKPMVTHEWEKAANRFIDLYPNRRPEIVTNLLDHVVNVVTFPDVSESILWHVAGDDPKTAWSILIRYLMRPYGPAAYTIQEWLRGDRFWDGVEKPGALKLFPPDLIWAWIDKDISSRAIFIAMAVPPYLFRRENETCFARELLIRYGESKGVRHQLTANFSTEGWKGPKSEHLRSKIEELETFLRDEDNEKVKGWVMQYVGYLKRDMENAHIDEERRGY